MTPHATQDQSDGLLLPGLDGTNPLGFLAALGTIRTLSAVTPGRQLAMSWQRGGSWHPVIQCPAIQTECDLIAALMDYNDSLKQASFSPDAPAFDFAGLGDIIGVDQEQFVAFHNRAQCYAQQGLPNARRREGLDFVAGYGSGFHLSTKGHVEPTRFSFANGQSGQCLLRSFRDIRDRLTSQDLHRALFEPWTYCDDRPTLRWEPEDCRPYAHRASDPGDSKASPIRTVRGANYLAFLALPMLPTVPGARGLQTSGLFLADGKYWTWPIWDAGLSVDCISSLLTLPDLQQDRLDTVKLRAVSVVHVCRSRRFSYQKGVYFSPSVSV